MQERFSDRARHAMAEFNGRLFLVGGCDDERCYNDVWSSADGAVWHQEAVTGTASPSNQTASAP